MKARAPFKNLEEIFEVDVRNTYRKKIDTKKNTYSDYELADFHKDISAAELNSCVPLDVQNQFNMSKNLCLYAWFVYDFAMASQLRAFIAVETALKIKYKEKMKKEPNQPGLRRLVKWAINHDMIKDGGFRHLYFEDKEGLINNLSSESEQTILKDRNGTVYSSGAFIDSLTGLRNSLTHGSPTFIEPYMIILSLEICADAINQLFSPNKKSSIVKTNEI